MILLGKRLPAYAVRRAEIRVPGHGPVCRGAEIAALLDDLAEYAAFVDAVARGHPVAGHPPLEAAVAEKDNRFASWQESEQLVGNLDREYSELV
jgi:hypothetical protein